MKKLILLTLNLFILIVFANAQNLVPNPSFEKLNKLSASWIRNKQEFDENIQEWTSPNVGSPDILFKRLINRISPKRTGVELSKHTPRTGEVMVGIKTYGCYENASHCREYLQVKLKKSLERGKQYFIEFWVNPMETSVYTNNIGVAFSDVEINDSDDHGIFYFEPLVNENEVIGNRPNQWHRISATIVAENNYEYLLLGNFLSDDLTETERNTNAIKYSYYLIDDVQVRPLDEEVEFEFSSEEFELGNVISLNNILFKTGKADLLSESYKELNKLYKALNENEKLVIQLNGHTDNQGEKNFNLELSEERALAVVNYLNEKGISIERLKYKGFGDSQPIASNKDSKDRRLNRRVEFIILNN